MPIYEYRCDPCNEIFEVVQRFDSCSAKCICGEITREKLMSLPSLHRISSPGDFAAPAPFQPFTEPVVTRDWLNPDGTTRPMKRDEWTRGNVPGLER